MNNLLQYDKKTIIITANFQKYGQSQGSKNKTTCIDNVYHEGIELADHIWLTNKILVQAKLHAGQRITLSAQIIKRPRPSKSIFDDPTFEGTLKNIKIITS